MDNNAKPKLNKYDALFKYEMDRIPPLENYLKQQQFKKSILNKYG